ncbi:mGnRH precursor [Arapaima gigas]
MSGGSNPFIASWGPARAAGPHHLLTETMSKGSALLWLMLLTALASLGGGQHWSYGLRPGGKRNAHESLQDVLQDITEDMELLHAPREPACVHPCVRKSSLREILNILAERDTGKKNILTADVV